MLQSANDSSLFEVPSLGPHFSTQWGVEDIEEEMRPSDIGSINTSANSDAGQYIHYICELYTHTVLCLKIH